MVWGHYDLAWSQYSPGLCHSRHTALRPVYFGWIKAMDEVEYKDEDATEKKGEVGFTSECLLALGLLFSRGSRRLRA